MELRPVQTIEGVLWHSHHGSHEHDVRVLGRKMLAQIVTVVEPNQHLNVAVQAKRHDYSVSFSHLNKMEAETPLLIASDMVVIATYNIF